MNRKLEKIAELIVVVVLVVFISVSFTDHSIEANLSMIINIVSWITIYLIQTKWLIPSFLKQNVPKYMLLTLSFFVIFLLILTFAKLIHLEEMFYRRYYSMSTKLDYLREFQWRFFKDTVYGLLLINFLSIIYGILRSMRYFKKLLSKQIIPIGFFSIVCLLSIGFLAIFIFENLKEYPERQFKTESNNDNIKFLKLNNSPSITFENIVEEIEAKNKSICLLFWTQSCGSQVMNAVNLNKLRNDLVKNDIVFIYACGEYQENDFNKWKDRIISKNIDGYHIFLERKDFHKLLIDEFGIKSGLRPSQVLLFNSSHELLNENPLAVRDKDKLTIKLNEL